MFCLKCFGTGVIKGRGEYRGVCGSCFGQGREIVFESVNERKEAPFYSKKKTNKDMTK